MDEQEQNKLKPEEIFGGFPPDENVFLEAPESDTDDFNLQESLPRTSEDIPEPIELKSEPKVIKIQTPIQEPVEYPKFRKSPWPYVSAIAVLILILSSAIYFIYNNLSLSNLSKFGMTEIKWESDKNDNEKNVENNTSENILIVNPDTAEANETGLVSEKLVTPSVEMNKDVMSLNKPKTYIHPEINKVPVKEKKSDPLSKKQEIKKQEPDITKWPAQKFEPDPEQKITKPENTSHGVYALEIYSSPSYEDARDWVSKLSRRNLQAIIIPRRVRDKIIYKVRIGNFSSEEEARKTAINMGLSRSYIDKIR